MHTRLLNPIVDTIVVRNPHNNIVLRPEGFRALKELPSTMLLPLKMKDQAPGFDLFRRVMGGAGERGAQQWGYLE